MQMPKVKIEDLPIVIETVTLKVDETKKLDMYGSNEEIKGEESYNKYIEKIIRGSFEYRAFTKALKTEMDLTKCKFIPEVDINDTKGVTIEMHHYPLSLYDIVSCYREKLKTNYMEKESYQSFKVAEDIIKMHFEGKVGIVPLSYTAHELAHTGDIFIPLNDEFVFGNYEDLFKEIELTTQLESKIQAVKDMTTRYENADSHIEPEVLNKVRTEIEMLKTEKPKKIIN